MTTTDLAQVVQRTDAETRNQAAELCGLSPDQAGRVLRRLVAAGKLTHQGANKGRFYTLPIQTSR